MTGLGKPLHAALCVAAVSCRMRHAACGIPGRAARSLARESHKLRRIRGCSSHSSTP